MKHSRYYKATIKPKLVFGLAILFFTLISYYLYQNFIASNRSTDQNTTSKEIYNRCKDSKNKGACYSLQFTSLDKNHSLNYVINTLSTIQNLDPAASDCHIIAHEISQTETAKDLTKWQDVLKKVDPAACSGGFVHGVIEAKIKFDPNFVLNQKTILEICSLVKQVKGMPGEENCVHFIGHLILVDTSGDTEAAISTCQMLPDRVFGCLTGVFMENMAKDSLAAHGLATKAIWDEQTAKEEEAACKKFSKEVAAACWRELGRIFVYLSKNDPDQVYQSCKRSGDDSITDECYLHSMAVMAIAEETNQNGLAMICRSNQPTAQEQFRCISYVNYLLLLNSTKQIDRATYLCKNLDNKYIPYCFRSIGITLKKLVNEKEQINICNNVPEKYENLCVKGDLVPVDKVID